MSSSVSNWITPQAAHELFSPAQWQLLQNCIAGQADARLQPRAQHWRHCFAHFAQIWGESSEVWQQFAYVAAVVGFTPVAGHPADVEVRREVEQEAGERSHAPSLHAYWETRLLEVAFPLRLIRAALLLLDSEKSILIPQRPHEFLLLWLQALDLVLEYYGCYSGTNTFQAGASRLDFSDPDELYAQHSVRLDANFCHRLWQDLEDYHHGQLPLDFALCWRISCQVSG